MKEHIAANTFHSSKSIVDKQLFDNMIEVVTKANLLLNCLEQDDIDHYWYHEPYVSAMKQQKKEGKKGMDREIEAYLEKYNVPKAEPKYDKLKMIEM